ncbi:MAG TPA: aminotransferase class III-fold pyridoxal phosphate-dependent enzyme, partial [Gaiellaceae bacterium]|nr:aminotransferase class III-fold pyridoxal phosphate-dependent enzyme [Gaiellaceae bacterium]
MNLQQAARDHLWMHFTRMGGYQTAEVPIIVRGDGCYLEDANGKRYLDALAGLFSVNLGYGFGEEMGQAALAQMKELPFYTNWSYAHPRAIELAARIAGLTPGDLNRVFFTSGGGEAVETADVPIIVRGDGCHLEDSNGRRYIDALAGLFSVNIGYSFGDEIGQAAHEQMRELPFYTNWSYAHPRAIELAAEVASLAPGDLNRVFFCSGGSEAVESAWKLARQYYAARGESTRRAPAEPET